MRVEDRILLLNTSFIAHMDLGSSSSNSSNTLCQRLLTPPKRWTSEHLKALNFSERSNVTAEEIVGDANLPSDGDQGVFLQSAHLTGKYPD